MASLMTPLSIPPPPLPIPTSPGPKSVRFGLSFSRRMYSIFSQLSGHMQCAASVIQYTSPLGVQCRRAWCAL